MLVGSGWGRDLGGRRRRHPRGHRDTADPSGIISSLTKEEAGWGKAQQQLQPSTR